MLTTVLVLILSLSSLLTVTAKDEDKTEGKVDTNFMNEQAYKSLFAAKRREQIETADKILGLDDYAKQYKMVEMLGDTVFPAIKNSKTKLADVGYLAGSSPFPDNKELREALSVIHESIPFFGDILLRLPQITKDVYRRHKVDWEPIFEWAMEFCKNSTSIFNGHHATQLHLMSQEIGLIPEDPDYMNPFRHASQKNIKFEKTTAKTSKKNKKAKKGPRLRTTSRNEL